MNSEAKPFTELLDPELSRVMDAAVEDRLHRERENPLTPDEYLEWLTSMAGFIPPRPFAPMEGNEFRL